MKHRQQNRRRPQPRPPLPLQVQQHRPPQLPPPAPQPPPSYSSMFDFGHFSPFSPLIITTTPNNFDLNDLADTVIADEGIAATPPSIRSPPFQIVPLNSNDPPPATDVEAMQQQKISTAEKSAKELETI